MNGTIGGQGMYQLQQICGVRNTRRIASIRDLSDTVPELRIGSAPDSEEEVGFVFEQLERPVPFKAPLKLGVKACDSFVSSGVL